VCNPRRVRIRATRALAEEWQHEIERVVTRRGEVVGEARVRERLAGSIGAPALAALEATLARSEGWERQDGTFVHQLDGGYVVYHLDGQELEMVATSSDVVETTARATAVARGELSETVQVEGVGVYYDDNWGGITRQDATRAAREAAERNIDVRRQELLEEARQQAERRQGDDLEQDATTRADDAYARQTQQRAEELREEAMNRLTTVGIQGRSLFHQVLAAAYRDAILAYARTHRAQNLALSEQGGVVEIQFELQA
jgi:hypothetical protein